jgi:hypothetical protein
MVRAHGGMATRVRSSTQLNSTQLNSTQLNSNCIGLKKHIKEFGCPSPAPVSRKKDIIKFIWSIGASFNSMFHTEISMYQSSQKGKWNDAPMAALTSLISGCDTF